MNAPVGAEHLSHATALVAGQQDQKLRRSRARTRMGDQHRASLGQEPAHSRHARVHRLNLKPDLARGIFYETSERHAVGDVGRRIVQLRRPSPGKETFGDCHQSIAQPGGWPSLGRRAGSTRVLTAAAHALPPCVPDGACSTICPWSRRKCRHSGPSRRARACFSAWSKRA